MRTCGPLFLSLLLASAGARAAPPLPTGRRLREIVAESFRPGSVLIGATTGSWAFGEDQGVLLDREFGYVTPENDFKQSVVHPSPGLWSWSRADAWRAHVVAQGQVLRIHGPIGPQCSAWAKDDARTPAELEANLREYFTALCRRYDGRPGFQFLDVVNETVIDGGWHRDKAGTRWECPWYKIGQDRDPRATPLYIRYAFEIAKASASHFKLVYNHHESPARAASWDLIEETIRYLRERGLRVDGIGWQAHVDAGWETAENIRALRALIRWAHESDLEFHVTEASVFIDGASPAELEAQARTYRSIVEVLLEERAGGPVRWNTWHISDAHGWRKSELPSLFDAAYAPKPAYHALQSLLEETRDPPLFRRGDANSDGEVDIADPIFTLGYLFLAGSGPDPAPGTEAAPACLDGADSNDDGAVDISDPIATLLYLFGGAAPLLPDTFARCAEDPTADALGCASGDGCRR